MSASEVGNEQQGAAPEDRQAAARSAPMRRSNRAKGRDASQRVRDTHVSEYEEMIARVSEAQAEAANEVAQRQDLSSQRDADAGDMDQIPSSEDVEVGQQSDQDEADPIQIDLHSGEDDVVETVTRQ